MLHSISHMNLMQRCLWLNMTCPHAIIPQKHHRLFNLQSFDTKVRFSIFTPTETLSHSVCFVADVCCRLELLTLTHRAQTHCLGRHRDTTRADTGWHWWRVHRGAGWGTVTSYTPSPVGGCEIDNQNLVCFQLGGGGRVTELEIKKTIHH